MATQLIGEFGVKNSTVSDEKIEIFSTQFSALGDPTRVRILFLLGENEEGVCVQDIATIVGLAQPTITHHLGILRRAGYITFTKIRTFRYYRLRPKSLPVFTTT